MLVWAVTSLCHRTPCCAPIAVLHCPNEALDWHPPNPDIRFFAEAIVRMNNYCLVQAFIEFLPTKANGGFCMADALDDGEYRGDASCGPVSKMEPVQGRRFP